jgi:hypothetical protein
MAFLQRVSYFSENEATNKLEVVMKVHLNMHALRSENKSELSWGPLSDCLNCWQSINVNFWTNNQKS